MVTTLDLLKTLPITSQKIRAGRGNLDIPSPSQTQSYARSKHPTSTPLVVNISNKHIHPSSKAPTDLPILEIKSLLPSAKRESDRLHKRLSFHPLSNLRPPPTINPPPLPFSIINRVEVLPGAALITCTTLNCRLR